MENQPSARDAHVETGVAVNRSADDELSREAMDAAMPELSGADADLVGWTAHAGWSPSGELSPSRGRRLLATALGVPESTIRGMGDDEVARAVERIRALAEQCRRLAAQVTVDELTGALRRGSGLAALQREVDRVRRGTERGLVVVFIDVDGLKAVNDRAGHAAGDELLRDAVASIRARLRSYDIVVRYGGDEFICVLTGTNLEQATRTARMLREQVAANTGGAISTGLAELVEGDTVDSLVERADADLYAQRRSRGHLSGARAAEPRA